jgi:ABC-type nickel/cobalt efflux system permease component RcnA
MIAALAGLVAGLIHVWSGPDHLAAIAPLAVRGRKRAWVPGVRWGMGHSAGVAVIGLLTLWLRELIPKDLVSYWGERLVGVMLVGIGVWALRKAYRVHAHEHTHQGDHRHLHLHAHRPGVAHEEPVAHHRHTHAAFGIGILHGLAGSSHFVGVLVLLAFPTRTEAVAYLAAFAAGTIISMGVFSWMIGKVAARYAEGSTRVYRTLMSLCAASAIVVGCFWLFT